MVVVDAASHIGAVCGRTIPGGVDATKGGVATPAPGPCFLRTETTDGGMPTPMHTMSPVTFLEQTMDPF